MKVREGSKFTHIRLGFAERADSFALSNALTDYFTDEEISVQEEEAPPKKLDLALKEGETMKVSLKFSRKTGSIDESPTMRRKAPSLPSPPGPPSPALARRDDGVKPTEGPKKWSLVRKTFLRKKRFSEKI